MQIISSLIISLFFIIIIGLIINNNKGIKSILLLALFVRFLGLIYHNFLDPISPIGAFPDSGNDEFYFSDKALYFYKEGLNISDILAIDFYPFFISIFYFFFGENVILFPLINTIFNLLTIVFIYKICKTFSDNQSSKNAALIFALIPMQIVYSSIGIREAMFSLLFTAFIFYFVSWFFGKSNSFKNLLVSILYFVFASILHDGVVFVLVPVFFMLLFFRANKINFISKSIFFLTLTAFIFSGALNYTMGQFFRSSDKFSYFEEVRLQLSEKDRRFSYSTQNSNPVNLLYNFSLRPYINEYQVGFLRIPNTILVYYLIYWIFKKRKIIRNNLRIKFLLAILFVSFVSFSLGSGDLFQSDRHRSKFMPIIVALITFSPKNKNING